MLGSHKHNLIMVSISLAWLLALLPPYSQPPAGAVLVLFCPPSPHILSTWKHSHK